MVCGDEFLAIVHGSFDGHLAPIVHADLTAALDLGVDRIIIDLCHVTLVDEGAMAVLAAATGVVSSGGGKLFVALEPERVVEISDASLVRAVFDR